MAKKLDCQIDKESVAKTAEILIELNENDNILDPNEVEPADVSKLPARETKRMMIMKNRHFLHQDETLETKRYKRFISRIKEDCYTTVKNLLISDCVDYNGTWMKKVSFEYLSSFNLGDYILAKVASIIFTDFNNHILDTRLKYYMENFNNSTSILFSFGIAYLTNMATVSEFSKEKNPLIWKMLVEQPEEQIDGIGCTGYDICEYEIENVIKDSLLDRGFFDDDVVMENYTSTLDVNMIDIQEILQKTVCRIIGHVYGICTEVGDGSSLETISGANKRLEEASAELTKLNDVIKTLSQQVAAYEQTILDQTRKIETLNDEKKKLKTQYAEEVKNYSVSFVFLNTILKKRMLLKKAKSKQMILAQKIQV